MTHPKFWDYWEGRDTIILVPQMVHADWKSNPNAIEFTNKALNIYYRARNNAEKIHDATLKDQLIKELEAAAKEGCSLLHWGDLETALRNLARPEGTYRNQWTDSKTATYDSDANKIWTKGSVEAPAAAVAFMTAMDNNMQDFRQLLLASSREWEQYTAKAKDPRHDWQTLGAILKRVGGIHSKTAKYLWLAPERLPGLPHLKVALDKSKPFLKYVTEVYGVADDFLKYRSYGYTTSDAAQVAALKRALGFFPILGEFYKNALDMIPTTKLWFTGLLRTYVAKIDSIPGLWH